MNEIKLSDHFDTKKILRFTTPVILMMVFYTTFVLVDGLFISNAVGSTAYAAVNIVGNYVLLFPAIGTMMGSGGAALISKTLGEKQEELASKRFSMTVWASILLGIVLTAIAYFTVDSVSVMQGAEGELLEDCRQYGGVAVFSVLFYMIQSEFQYFFSLVEKEKLGFLITVIAGCINIGLDALFILVFKWSLFGAAFASLLGMIFSATFSILYFMKKKGLSVRLGRPVVEWKALLKIAGNGSSEMVENLSLALVGMLFNHQLMVYSGEDAVAAYGVVQAVTLVFMAVFLGYSAGLIPVIGYHFGDGNTKEVNSLLKKSIRLILFFSIFVFLVTEFGAELFARIFLSYDQELCDMAVRGLRIYSSVFLVAGYNIFGSGFFTSLNDGLDSAIVSLARTVVFLIAAIMILPVFFGLDGIWLSTTVAELLSIFVTVGLVLLRRKKFGYLARV